MESSGSRRQSIDWPPLGAFGSAVSPLPPPQHDASVIEQHVSWPETVQPAPHAIVARTAGAYLGASGICMPPRLKPCNTIPRPAQSAFGRAQSASRADGLLGPLDGPGYANMLLATVCSSLHEKAESRDMVLPATKPRAAARRTSSNSGASVPAPMPPPFTYKYTGRFVTLAGSSPAMVPWPPRTRNVELNGVVG